jgi:exonuclease SbcD
LRFIHTSDWHLGQTLHGFERGFEHQHFLDWLLDTMVAEQTDGLLVCGDIFDNANPSAASQKQLYRFLQQARARVPHLNIVIIAGNHDSPGRLEAPGPLLEALEATVIGFVPRLADGTIDVKKLVVPLKNRLGEVAAWCLAIPFLRPGDVPQLKKETEKNTADDSASSDPYLDGIALLYRQALEHALTLRQPGQAIVALGHCHMVGGQISEDSERRIVIGGSEALSAGIFGPAIAYAALGHLHLAQSIGKQAHLRYCGSPLPLSFAEIGYPHQVLRVDLDGENVAEIRPLPVPRAVELLRVPPQPAPLDQVLAALAALDLGAPNQLPPLQRQPYLEVRIRLDVPEPGLRSRIEAALEGKPLRLARIDTSLAAKAASSSDHGPVLEQLERLQPDDIFNRLYRSKYDADTPAELQAAFAELMLAAATEPR